MLIDYSLQFPGLVGHDVFPEVILQGKHLHCIGTLQFWAPQQRGRLPRERLNCACPQNANKLGA